MAKYAYFEGIYRQDPTVPGWNSPTIDQEVLAYALELLREAPLGPPARLLEIGCGMGNLSLPLARQGFWVTGVDVSATAIDQARLRADHMGNLAPDFVVGDVTRPEAYADIGRVGGVLDGLCLHCIVGDDRQRLMRLIHDALSPGGCFLVMTMCGDPRSEALQQRFNTSTRCVTGSSGPQRYLGQPEALLAELAAAGFRTTYWRVHPGNDVSGDQDMLLAVACALKSL